jgi:hypothetical protein
MRNILFALAALLWAGVAAAQNVGGPVLVTPGSAVSQLSANPQGARSAENLPGGFVNAADAPYSVLSGQARSVNPNPPYSVSYYIASGSNKLYAGFVFNTANFDPASGTCYFQSGSPQIGVPSIIAPQKAGDFNGYTATFLGVNGGADWSTTINSIGNIGYQVINAADTPTFGFNSSVCTVIIGPPAATPTFTSADLHISRCQ